MSSTRLTDNELEAAVPLVVAVARAAAAAVLEEYRRVAANDAGAAAFDKADGSPLTTADLRSHATIAAGLEAQFPHIPVISEEDGGAVVGAVARPAVCWLVDPLDGTKEFLKRSGEFTVNIAYVEDGVPTMGVVVAPVSGHAWYASPRGAWREGPDGLVPLGARACPDGLPRCVVASRDHAGDGVRAMLAQLPAVATIAVGSSLKFLRIAEGAADLYFRDGPTMAWDTAAAHAVLRGAGGEVFDLAGTPLAYRAPRATNPAFVAVGDRTLPWPNWVPSTMLPAGA